MEVPRVYRARLLSQPTIAPDGTIYLGRAKHPMCAVSPTTGTKVWCTFENDKGNLA